jgi:microsomal dipeptidase-like Zn-dependent dipeptidase
VGLADKWQCVWRNKIDDYLKAWNLLYRLEEKYKNDLKIVGSSSEMKLAMKEGKIAILPSL